MSSKFGVFTIPTGFTGPIVISGISFLPGSIAVKAASSGLPYESIGAGDGPTSAGRTRCISRAVLGGVSEVGGSPNFVFLPGGLVVDLSSLNGDGFTLDVTTNVIPFQAECIYYAQS